MAGILRVAVLSSKRSMKKSSSPKAGRGAEANDARSGWGRWWWPAAAVLLAAVVGGAAYWLSRRDAQPPDGVPAAPFVDITAEAGIDFVHENGAAGEKLLPETMGGGCAWFDFDGDGDQDLLLLNGRRWPWDDRPNAAPSIPALYRNDGRGRFENVAAGSGLDVSLYGMGVAVGDYDNDGRVDVFLSALGANHLFRNLGDGRFADVTETAGVAGSPDAWSTSCGFFDYDNDGDLDLFVCNYIEWSREKDLAQNFQLIGGGPAYGRPQNFVGAHPYLYRNDGGTFTDVSAEAGVQIRDPASGKPRAKSLGLTFIDVDRDGWLDVLVANDTVPNFLFHSQRDGTFREIGALAGIAFDAEGAVRGAMGIDAARLRGGNVLAAAIGNFSGEMTALYVAHGGELQFTDEAVAAGIGAHTQRELTFGVFFADYDLDGRLDLLAANGHLEPEIRRVQPHQHYAQPPQLFWNRGPQQGPEFLLVPGEKCGEDFIRPMVGRSAAYADIDGDGDLDVLFTAAGDKPRLLRNEQQLGHHWLRLKLIGRQCNRDAIGAWVEVRLANGTLWRQVMPTRSYLSQLELPVTFGLGKEKQVTAVVIHWPDGTRQTLEEVQLNTEQVVEQKVEIRENRRAD
jgi:enediyne biosynthesis protein E4